MEEITISAEKNAPDKNREFKMEEVTGEELEKVAEQCDGVCNGNGTLLNVWELDAGLSDDEVLPGHFRMSMKVI